LKFRLIYLFAIVTGFAVVFALLEWSMLAASFGSIIIFGPTVACATSDQRSAFVPGLVSAAFWAIPTLFFVGVLFSMADPSGRGMHDPRWLIAIPITVSVIGGYVGGRIALH